MCWVATNLPLLLEIIYDMVNCDSTSVAIDVMPKLLSLFCLFALGIFHFCAVWRFCCFSQKQVFGVKFVTALQMLVRFF